MEILFIGDFDVSRMKDASIIFTSKNKNIKINKNLPMDVQVSFNKNTINLKLTNIYVKENEVLFKFNSANIAIPIFLKNAAIEVPKISAQIPKISAQIPRQIKNPYIYTNVESGYSARSFPQVYIQRYKYGPQGDKLQTTPQVAPVFSPR